MADLNLDLASSMKLEFPLNEALPSTDHARDRLLVRIFKFRKDSRIPSENRDKDFALLYAYGKIHRNSFSLMDTI